MAQSSRAVVQSLKRNLFTAFVLATCLSAWPKTGDATGGDGAVDGNGSACCPCDCNADVIVTVDEIVRAVNAALNGGVDCRSGSCFEPGPITVDYIIMCINSALTGCTA